MLAGLRRNGAQVEECHFQLPYAGVAKRRLLVSPWLWPTYLWRLWRGKGRAQNRLRQLLRAFPADVLLVPYPGQLTVTWARQVFKGPIILDLFLSAFDTAVLDRQMFRPTSCMGRLLLHLDQRACRAADRVLLDTPQHAAHISQLLQLPASWFDWLPVADAAEVDEPMSYRAPKPGAPLRLLFFGTGVPLHGLSILLDAVQQCEGVQLSLIGGNAADRARAHCMGEQRVRMLPSFVVPEVLQAELRKAHLVAGIFGTTQKTQRVVPFKLIHALAVGRPVITAATPVVNAWLRPGMDCFVVPAGDARHLAMCLQELHDDPAPLADVATASRYAYEQRFSLQSTGQRLMQICAGLNGCKEPRAELDPVEVSHV